MAPTASSYVSIQLSEPVVFLKNLDSATDRRERRQQRRRQTSSHPAISDAGSSLGGRGRAHFGGFTGAGPTGGAMEISVIRERESSATRISEEYLPPTGRGGAGSRSRSRGRNATNGGSPAPGRSRSATPGPGPNTLLARERGRSPAPARTLSNGASAGNEVDPSLLEDARGERIEPEEANIDLVRPPAILRGVLTMHLTKPTKIRKIGVKLVGEAKTEWPEGIGARRLDTTDRTHLFEEQVIFFDARTKRGARSVSRANSAPSVAAASPAASPAVTTGALPSEPAPEYTAEPPPPLSTPSASSVRGLNNRTADLRLEEGVTSQSSPGPSTSTSRASSIADAEHSPAQPHGTATPDGYPGHPLENIETNVSQASLTTSHSGNSASEERGRSGRRRRSAQRDIPENEAVTSAPAPLSPCDAQVPDTAANARPASRRNSSVGVSALKKSVNSARSPSTSSAKSARFSLGSLLRGKSSSRPPLSRTLSPEGIEEEPNGRSRSSSGLQAIKQALHSHSFGDKHNHSHTDTDADSDGDEDGRGRSKNQPGWEEFQPGIFEYAINIPVPQSLPPTIHTNHGCVEYWLKGFASRAGALTTRLTTSKEVHVVAAPNEDDMEAFEPITVERMWETELSYKIVIHSKSAPIGGEIPVSITLHPLGKMKVYRFTAILEEKFTFYAKDRRIARTPNLRKHELLRIDYADGSPLLPILDDSPDALLGSPLRQWMKGVDEEGITTLDPLGPWKLEGAVKMPDCSGSVHFSSSNPQANITVLHSLKLCLRVEKGDETQRDAKGQIKRYDLVVEAPMHVLSCRSQEAGSLPVYTTSPDPQIRSLRARSVHEPSFHPHELSEGQRAHLYRSTSGYGPTQHASPVASPSSERNAQLPTIPPSYGYVQTHPEQALAAPLPAGG